MPEMSFEKFILELVHAVDEANTIIIDRITDPAMRYEWACIKPDLTYKAYYELLKPRWDAVVDRFASQTDECESVSRLLFLAKVANVGSQHLDVEALRRTDPNALRTRVQTQIQSQSQTLDPQKLRATLLRSLNPDTKDPQVLQIQNMVLEALADSVVTKATDIHLNPDVVQTAYNLINLLKTKSICTLWDLLVLIATKKYQQSLGTKTKAQIVDELRADYRFLATRLQTLTPDLVRAEYETKNLTKITDQLTGMHAMTIESELNKMIPDKLASLKQFFVKTISHYYNNLHPIIWAQILREILVNFLRDPPLSEDALFRFLSKNLLLNSGPFILKILQQVRPAMPQDLMKKYNLTKLTYPVMTPSQYNLILSKVVKGWPMYVVDYDKSASVGHVFIVHRADDPGNKFVVKVAKPLSIAQSCWEYSALDDLFPPGTCEKAFVHSMLVATGKELYSPNEIKNVNQAHEIYTMSYGELFPEAKNLAVKLTTVSVVEDVIVDDCWFAFAMTLAPGVPISSLIEGETSQLQTDTLYRAILHRGLDLLVFKFFINIVQHGYYHGDLHAGNVFFHYGGAGAGGAGSQLTMIDFGAVGRIDIHSDDPDIRRLLEIIIMSVFFNYPDLLDAMTELVNSKCSEDTKIDMNSPDYREFRGKLKRIQLESMIFTNTDKLRAEEFKKFLFSPERLALEASAPAGAGPATGAVYGPHRIESPYDYLDLQKRTKRDKETVTDNTQALPFDFPDQEEGTKVTSFAQVLAMITEFYALSGVNIAIKFAEFYELLKAYVLVIGLLSQTNYHPLRTSIVMGKLFYDTGNLKALLHIGSVYHMYTAYKAQKTKYDALRDKITRFLAERNLTLEQVAQIPTGRAK